MVRLEAEPARYDGLEVHTSRKRMVRVQQTLQRELLKIWCLTLEVGNGGEGWVQIEFFFFFLVLAYMIG